MRLARVVNEKSRRQWCAITMETQHRIRERMSIVLSCSSGYLPLAGWRERYKGVFMPVIRACTNCGQKNRIPGKFLANVGRCGACKAPLPPMAEPIAADEALFDEVIQNATVPVLVDFW